MIESQSTKHGTNPIPEAQAKSLPHCLRHAGTWEALEDARKLVSLLSEVAFLNLLVTENKDGWLFNNQLAAGGFDLLINLIMDKLDIASGHYRFPVVGWESDTPNLAERVEE